MLFSTVLTWLLIAAAFVIALPALWLLSRGLWPHKSDQLRAQAERSLFKSFWLGVPPLIFGILLVTALAKLPKLGGLAALTGGVFIVWGLIGAGGIASLIGERLWPQSAPWQQTKWGGLTLVCCALLPVVGWFVLLPLMAVTGAGLQLRTWFTKKVPAVSTLAATEPPTP